MHLSSLSALMGFALAASAQKIKFLPLGDSITEITCWRALVWDQLAAEGLTDDIDFVGSMTNNPQGCTSATGNFDTGHEGHSGWQSVNIANQYITGWAADSAPDIVNFMLGTNDVVGGRTLEQIIASYDTIVEALRVVNPKVKIIIDKVIPLSFSNAPIKAINAAIPAWAERQNTADSPVVIADCSDENGFTTGMLRDGVHPNAAGDEIIASEVGPLLIQFVKDLIAERG
ncbi:related to acetylxylan esterase [Cephalotrichum gorgonifer]|uniref:Related to acetylxylan esterase n=1 Tax=Cephalotrichum gorgonifer TaxID=2041049 RepID=A0AAE8N3T7_9PEZI|nr:related to acetylxylan esterase [Cephalotrichum gorgonifer]